MGGRRTEDGGGDFGIEGNRTDFGDDYDRDEDAMISVDSSAGWS